MLVKTSFLLLSTTYLCLLASSSEAQIKTAIESVGESTSNTNICQLFSHSTEIDIQTVEAPSPVRKLINEDNTYIAFTPAETKLYQSLGLIQNQDGSYTCMALDPHNSQRRFSIFKVKKVDEVVVISTFLDKGEFILGQQEAITNIFLEMIRFYTDIPHQYYTGIQRYLKEFYLRIADGRIKPSSDRAYLIDEPEATIILYHPLQNGLQGTGLSLNIPLN